MLLAFGEIMMRINPPGMLRFRQALPGPVDVVFGGGEANVCGSLALLGRPVRYLTALPKHVIADALVGTLRGLGIDTALHRAARRGPVGNLLPRSRRESAWLGDRLRPRSTAP